MNKIQTVSEAESNIKPFSKNFDLKFNGSDYDLIIVPFYTDEYVLQNFTNVKAISLSSIICETQAKYTLPHEFDNKHLKKIEMYIKEEIVKAKDTKTEQIRIGFIELPMQYSKISEQLISLNLELIFLSHAKKDPTKTEPLKNISYNTKFEQVKAVKEILNDSTNTNSNTIIGADDQAFLEIYNAFDEKSSIKVSDIKGSCNYLQTIWNTQLGQQIYRSAQYIVYNDEEFLKYFDQSQLDIDGLKNLGYYMHDMRPDMVLETHLHTFNIDREIALKLKQSFVNYMLNCMDIRHNYICILTHWLQNTYNIFRSEHFNNIQNNFIFPVFILPIHTIRLLKINANIILSGFTQSDPYLSFTEKAIRYSENVILLRNHSYIEAVSKFLPKADKNDNQIRCIEPTKKQIEASKQQNERDQNTPENKTFCQHAFCTYIYSIKQFIKRQKDHLKLEDYIKVVDPEEENIKFHLHKMFFNYISEYNTKTETNRNLFNVLFSHLPPYKQSILEIKWKDIKKHYDDFLDDFSQTNNQNHNNTQNHITEKYSSKKFYMSYSIPYEQANNSSTSQSNYNVQIEARIDCILNDRDREKFILIELETGKKPILTEEITLKFFIAQQRLLKYKTSAQIAFYILNTEGMHEIKTESITKKANKILVTEQ